MATTGTFITGLRDGYPLYQVYKKPALPESPSRAYGAGMAASGVGSVILGLAPLAGYVIRNGKKVAGHEGAAGAISSMMLFGAATAWAAPHVLIGVGSAFTGARIVATGS